MMNFFHHEESRGNRRGDITGITHRQEIIEMLSRWYNYYEYAPVYDKNEENDAFHRIINVNHPSHFMEWKEWYEYYTPSDSPIITEYALILVDIGSIVVWAR